MIAKKIATTLGYEPDVSVKCRVIRTLYASRAVALGCLRKAASSRLDQCDRPISDGGLVRINARTRRRTGSCPVK
jgi:hypothetical protein